MIIPLIALTVSLAALAVVVWYARDTDRSASEARAANREAWGMLAEVQLRNLKRRRP